MDQHLDHYGLMEGQQRGAKSGCFGTMDNLLIDRAVMLDCQRGKRNLSMAWIDVRKAYDSVDHDWLCAMTDVHRFPIWLGEVIRKLCASWNTRVVATTREGRETSRNIRFMKGLYQGDVLCPRLFTLCLNPVAWRLRATEGYRLSKPIGVKVTDLLYIDDLKVFAASESKLNRVLKETRGAMQDIGLHWNQKKCSVVHVKRGAQVLDESGMRMDETTTITALGEGKHYKFLGVLENVRQDERLALACAAKEYLRRISIIWSTPLSDCNCVQATNQYSLLVLRYLMWTQHRPLSELRNVDRPARKIIVENGGKHPASLTSLLYLPREKGGRGLRSVEHEYKITEIKSLLKLYQNSDQTVDAVREFEEHAMASGHLSLMREAAEYAEELNITLQLDTLNTL